MQPMSVAAKPPFGLRPPGDLAATRRSGQFTCYKTGQIYLLLTVLPDIITIPVIDKLNLHPESFPENDRFYR